MKAKLRNFSLLLLIFLFFPHGSQAREISLKELLNLSLKNNAELKALQRELKALELEKEAAKGAYYPRLKLEETFLKSNLPVNVFSFKLNQQDFNLRDFEIKRLNDPGSRTNFETRFTIELPIWLGGKIQAQVKQITHLHKAMESNYLRKEEEILSKIYQAYLWAALSKESIKVAQSSIREAEEHLRVAKLRYEAGTALLSDVHRAEVYLAKAQESLEKAKNYYQIAKRNIELLVGISLGDFEVEDLRDIPPLSLEEIRNSALLKRADLKALEEEIKAQRERYKVTLSENLPQVSAFASYSLNDKDYPFGSSGSGYLFGLNLSWSFDTGLTVIKKAQADLQRVAALEERYRYLREAIFFELDRAYGEYKNASASLKSAEERVKASEEVLRIMKLRYQNGLVRMLDLLDAQTQLDLARYERIEALKDLHLARLQLLLAGGQVKESLL